MAKFKRHPWKPWLPFLWAALVTVLVFCPGPAAPQVSPVPPGLVLPIGNTLKVWESGAADFSTAGSVNRILAYKNGYFSATPETYYAPFSANQGVPAIMPAQTTYFVRMYAPAAGINQVGGWVMRAAEVRGLTPEQIRDRFALPSVPTNITMVAVPPNIAALWTGYAGPVAGWGQGGGQQTYIMSRLTTYYYDAANPALPLTDYTDNGGVYYNYISTANYLHGQALGPQAMLYKPTVGGGNAGRVAAYLDQFTPPPYSDLENVYTLLDYLNYSGYGPGPLKAAMKQISPERYDALSTLGLRANLLFGDALMQRNQALRLGLAHGSGEAAANALPEGLGRLARLAYACSFSDPRLVSPGMLPSQVSQRGLGVWARGVGEFGNQGSFGERTGFVYNTGGVVGGIDWQPRRDMIVGLGAAYLGTGLNWDQSGGSADVSYAKFGLYGSYFTPLWFVDGVFSGGVNWASTQRNISILSDTSLIPGVSRTATSNQTGHDLTVQCRGGVNLPLGSWSLTPMAGLAYFYLHQDPFAEQGAASLNLNVKANEAQTLRSTLGARLARTFTAPSGNKITPEASLGWAHDFVLDNRVINASIAELGGSFATYGFNGDANNLLAGAGATVQLANGVAVSGRYHAEVGRSFTSHMVNLGLRYEF